MPDPPTSAGWNAAGRMNSVANRERSRMADNKSVTQQDVDAMTKAERGGLRQLFTSETAAGVTPGMRDAWPMVRGRTFVSFSCISRDKLTKP